jgi:S-methylmethionine-dependent homocysteine/selenocysteine methylase
MEAVMGKTHQFQGYDMIADAIGAQRCVLLDGGVATELPRLQGHDYEHLWGFEALDLAPDAVLDIHRHYVDAGVDVITTNTWALPTLLRDDANIAWEDRRRLRWMETARQGVRIARQAIADAGRDDACVVAFSLNGDLVGPDGPDTVVLLARALVDDPPDLFLFETLSMVGPPLFEVVDALLGTSIPVWLSFRRCLAGPCGVYGEHWGGPEGDTFGRTARRFEEMGVMALLVNCIPPDHVDGMVSYLRHFSDMPLGVYPNLGYYTSAGWQTEDETGGTEYAKLALRWRAEGAQIIGGCCGTRPEHIAAARRALQGTIPGRERRDRTVHDTTNDPPDTSGGRGWLDQRGRSLHPLAFPKLSRHAGVSGPIPGTYLLWRYLFDHRVGAHQRCLDVGSGIGLQTVQLALNGAAHVHAIDLEEAAVANTLDSAFRVGVGDRVTAEAADLYPWIPEERYELIVANLPQLPAAPVAQLTSHRPVDYWGRGLVDQLIAKLPRAMAAEGRALVVVTSVVARDRTVRLLTSLRLTAEVLAWEVQELPVDLQEQSKHLAEIERVTDAYTLHLDGAEAMVTYLLEIRHAEAGNHAETPW